MKTERLSFLFFCFYPLFLIPHNMCAQKIKDSTLHYYNVIIKGEDATQVNRAFEYYEQLREKYVRNGDSSNAAYALEMVAIGKYNYGKYNESEQKAVLALGLIDSKSDSTSIKAKKRLLNHLGMLYRKLGAYEKGLELYKRSIQLSNKTSDSIAIINNVSNLFREQGRYELAADTLSFVFKMALRLNDVKLKAYALDNLGFAQSKTDHPDALPNMISALTIRLNSQDYIGLFSSYRHLALFHKEKNLNKDALVFANKALSTAYNINDITYEIEALGLVLELDDNNEFQRYKFLRDSILSSEQQQENQYALMQYDLEKERRLTETSELQREKEKRQKLLYQAIGILVLLISVFTFIMVRARHKKEKLKQIYIAESRISKKVHDEVANDVYLIMTKLQSNTDILEEVIDDLEEIYNKTRNISKESVNVNVKEDFGELINDLLASYRTTEISIITKNNSKIEWNKVSDLKKTTIYRVLQELMTNNRKHSKASLALITFHQKGSKILVQYTDNGIGCELKKNNGLQYAENRVNALNGTIIFESERNHGFKANIEI